MTGLSTCASDFTGKERDQESGNDYAHYRYYASSMGRWDSPDPTGLFFADASNPQTFNLYSYVSNYPLIAQDPNGLSWFNQAPCSGTYYAANTVMGEIKSFFANLFANCGGVGDSDDGGDNNGGWMTSPPMSVHYLSVSAYTNKVILMGHMGDGLDSNKTNGWATSKNFTMSDRVLVAVGIPFKGHERRDQTTYPGTKPKYLYHSLNDDQYRIIRDRIQARYDPKYGEQHEYELFLNSCGQNVSDDLRAAHIPGAPPRWLFIPNLDYFWLRLQAH
jgi:RHS repeat-associated protein